MKASNKPVWNEFEDMILTRLRVDRNIKKWCVIAKLMEFQFLIPGKNGKRCRERFQELNGEQVGQEDWPEQEEKKLIKLHNLYGNRWVQIGKRMKRSDNSVKNHYHLRLRKAMRKINCFLSLRFKNEIPLLKSNLFTRLVNVTELYFSADSSIYKELGNLSIQMQNSVLQYADDAVTVQSIDPENLFSLLSSLKQFQKTFKIQNVNVKATTCVHQFYNASSRPQLQSSSVGPSQNSPAKNEKVGEHFSFQKPVSVLQQPTSNELPPVNHEPISSPSYGKGVKEEEKEEQKEEAKEEEKKEDEENLHKAIAQKQAIAVPCQVPEQPQTTPQPIYNYWYGMNEMGYPIYQMCQQLPQHQQASQMTMNQFLMGQTIQSQKEQLFQQYPQQFPQHFSYPMQYSFYSPPGPYQAE